MTKKAKNREFAQPQNLALAPVLANAALSVLVIALTAACGSVEPSHKKGDVAAAAQTSGSGSVPAATGSGDGTGAGSASAGSASDQTASFDLTATYKKRQVDFIIIRSYNSRQGWVDQRINDALATLAARLEFLAPDVNVAVFDNFWVLDPKKAPTSGADARLTPVTAIVDTKNTKPFLNTAMPAVDFSAALAERVKAAGVRNSPDNGQGYWQPMQLLSAIKDEAAKGSKGVLNGLLRKDAYLSVLFLDYDESVDHIEISDVMTKFADLSGNFAASTLAPDETGCIYDPAAIPPSETNPSKYPQRNETIRLQKATYGMFGSLCSASYSLFFDDMVTKGSGSDYFTSALPVAAKPDSIKVFVANVELKDFRYWPGTTKLELPTTINSGVKVHITYIPLVPVAESVQSSDNPDPDVPVATEKTLSPQETAFLKDVAPLLNKYCANCHGGNAHPFSTAAAGIFASAQGDKASIYDRINRANADAQVMPQGGWPANSDADKAALINYFK